MTSPGRLCVTLALVVPMALSMLASNFAGEGLPTGEIVIAPFETKGNSNFDAPLERDLVTLHQAHPLIIGMGRDIYLSKIQFAGTEVYEMTYEYLPGSDCFSQKCADALVVYVGHDKRLHQLNVCPVRFSSDTVQFPDVRECSKRLRECLEEKGPKDKLGQEAIARLFISLSCHAECGDFPQYYDPSREFAAQGWEVSAEQGQKIAAALAKAKSVEHCYAVLARYSSHYAKSYTTHAVEKEYWRPIVLYRVCMSKNGYVASVNGEVMNRP